MHRKTKSSRPIQVSKSSLTMRKYLPKIKISKCLLVLPLLEHRELRHVLRTNPTPSELLSYWGRPLIRSRSFSASLRDRKNFDR